MNIRGELQLELAANRAGPENQAGLVPGPDEKKFSPENQIRHYARSPRKMTAWCVNQCMSEKRGVSLFTLTVKHPVCKAL